MFATLRTLRRDSHVAECRGCHLHGLKQRLYPGTRGGETLDRVAAGKRSKRRMTGSMVQAARILREIWSRAVHEGAQTCDQIPLSQSRTSHHNGFHESAPDLPQASLQVRLENPYRAGDLHIRRYLRIIWDLPVARPRMHRQTCLRIRSHQLD